MGVDWGVFGRWGCKRDSRTPGRNESRRMSVWGRRERRRDMEAECLRSRQMEVLCVVRRSAVGGGRSGVVSGEENWGGCEGGWARGWGRSIRRTETP